MSTVLRVKTSANNGLGPGPRLGHGTGRCDSGGHGHGQREHGPPGSGPGRAAGDTRHQGPPAADPPGAGERDPDDRHDPKSGTPYVSDDGGICPACRLQRARRNQVMNRSGARTVGMTICFCDRLTPLSLSHAASRKLSGAHRRPSVGPQGAQRARAPTTANLKPGGRPAGPTGVSAAAESTCFWWLVVCSLARCCGC